jgi:hypothetical protein
MPTGMDPVAVATAAEVEKGGGRRASRSEAARDAASQPGGEPVAAGRAPAPSPDEDPFWPTPDEHE